MAITMRPNSMVMVSETSIYAEFNCETVSELSDFTTWNGNDLVDGCVTLCIPEGIFYTICDGTWYADGQAVS